MGILLRRLVAREQHALPELRWEEELLLLLARRFIERSAIGIEHSFHPSVSPHMWAVATRLIRSGCRIGWWVGSGSVWVY